eukprot:205109-Pelagomonas_calceolata.AAC.2
MEPFLYKGVILAVFHSVGMEALVKSKWKRLEMTGARTLDCWKALPSSCLTTVHAHFKKLGKLESNPGEEVELIRAIC